MKFRGGTLVFGAKIRGGVLEKCLKVGKSVKSLGKVTKKRVQKLEK